MGPPLAWTLWVGLRGSGSHLPNPSGSFLSFEVPTRPSGWSDWRLLGQSERDWGAQRSNMGPWTV